MRRLGQKRRFAGDERGVAAIEMSLITGIFAIGMLNAVELGRYAYILMEAEQATQAGAQAALVTCDLQHVPATTNCTELDGAVTTAVQATSLGTKVTLDPAIDEGWYCLDDSHALVFAGDVSSKPSDCSSFGSSALAPVLYLQVHTTYTYAPIFQGVTIGQTFPKSIQKTSWMRMQ